MGENHNHSAPFRISIGGMIDKIFWGALLLIAGYVASQIQDATKSISELNAKMSVVISQIANQNKVLDNHETRIIYLERKK